MDAIVVNHVSKSYGKVQALSDVSFSVAKGEVFGLIGPDGAGKTSMFRILCSLLLPDAGTAAVDGYDVVRQMHEVRSRVGYMPGKFSLYQDLTVEENLNFFATLFGTTVDEGYDSIKAIYSQIERFKDRKAGALSGGMKQKLALSCALVHQPSVLFLDEPTTGVDPVSRKELWEMLLMLKERGITIVASTPYLDEVRCCERVAFLDQGKVRGICPGGWHIPMSDEWNTLYSAMENSSHAMQVEGVSKWSDATDAYAFSVLPAGYYFYGYFRSIDSYACFWSATENGSSGDYWYLVATEAGFSNDDYENVGCSVRCIKD